MQFSVELEVTNTNMECLSPIVAEIIPVKGDIVPEKVLRDLFYLTYLNWSSPRRSYSIPAPLRLAHELAFELSLGIQRYGPP